MIDDNALERIDAALARIERAAAVSRDARAQDARRHDMLSARVRDAIAAIDTMIAHGKTD